MSEQITVVIEQPVTITKIVRTGIGAASVQNVSQQVVTRQNVTRTQTVDIAVPVQTTQTTEVGLPGIQGPPGQTGAATFDVVAGADLTYPVVVAIVNGAAHPADPTNIQDMISQLAVTVHAAASGQPVTVATQYEMTEGAWSWVQGRVYLALTGGGLTQTIADTGAILEVGRAISATTIQFGIEPAILR